MQAGAAVKEEVVRALIVLISNAPELHGYAVRAFYRALAAHLDRAEFALVMAATWLIGGVWNRLLATETSVESADLLASSTSTFSCSHPLSGQ